MIDRHVLVAIAALLLAGGCDDDPPKKNPFEPPPKETNTPPPASAMPKPSGAPQLAIDDLGPKVGYTRVLLERPEGKDKLDKELEDVKSHFEGKDATLVVVRKAKMSWVVTMIDALSKIGVKQVVVKTETRKEFPGELAFTPQDKAPTPTPCALAGMILRGSGNCHLENQRWNGQQALQGFCRPRSLDDRGNDRAIRQGVQRLATLLRVRRPTHRVGPCLRPGGFGQKDRRHRARHAGAPA